MNETQQAPYRILDLTRSVAGPWTTRMLADAGFDVVKLEPPHGDFVRHLPAHISEFDSGYFRQCNSGKRSICLDLRSTRGREILWRLVPHFDVIMHNMRPEAAARLGITYDAVREANPTAIFTHISGYGSNNAFVRRPGQDLAVQCVTGVADLTGAVDGPPSVPIWSLIDTLTSSYAYVAICSALLARANGRISGAYIEVVMSQVAALLHDVAPMLSVTGKSVTRAGRFHPYFVVRGVVTCRDGFVAISAFRGRDWPRLADVIGQPHRRNLSMADRVELKDEIEAAVDETFSNLTVSDSLARLASHGVPGYRVPESLADVEETEFFQRRGMLVRTDDGAVLVANMLHRGRSAEHLLRGSPPLGAANYEVLGEYAGLAGSELLDLLSAGIVECEPAVVEDFVARCSQMEGVNVA